MKKALFIIYYLLGTHIYRNTASEYFLLSSSNDTFSVVNVIEPLTTSQGVVSFITSRKLNINYDDVVVHLRMRLFLIPISSKSHEYLL